MRILFLSPRLPHPRVLSGHVIVYQRVRRLIERGHEVTLCCFATEEERDLACDLEHRLAGLRLVAPPRDRTASLARRISGQAGMVALPRRRRSQAMLRAVGELVEQNRYDVVVGEFTEMGVYLYRNPFLSAVRTVLSCHQSPTVASRKRTDVVGYSLAGLVERLRHDRLRRFEFSMYRAFDRVLVLTPQERFQLEHYQPDLRLTVIPCGVDENYFRPRPSTELADGALYTGFYAHEPNRDAVRWFATHVWPRIRGIRPDMRWFYVVGPAPPPEFYDLARRDASIVVTGEVKDVRDYLDRARVFVCPVRMGSGMRVKILEAMAHGVPVVSTTLGAEGLPAQPGEHCFVADDPAVMAGQIRLLLEDPPLRASMIRKARDLVHERLSWTRSVDLLETTLAEVARRRG